MDAVRVNLGCGLQCPPGWINVDNSMGVKLAKFPIARQLLTKVVPKKWDVLPNPQWAENVQWMDITRRFIFEDNSVDYIYSSHLLEHLTWNEAKFTLSECLLVLKPGGVVRIIVPDLLTIVKGYLADRKTNPHLAAKNFLKNTLYFEIPVPRFFLGLIKFYFRRKNNHHFLYDYEGLKYLLELTGFRGVSLMQYGESRIPGIKEIDIPDRFRGAICVEAIK